MRAIGSCADEPGYDWDDAGFEERKKNVAAALLGLFEMRLGVTKSIASQDELGGRDGHRGNAGLFEERRPKSRALKRSPKEASDRRDPRQRGRQRERELHEADRGPGVCNSRRTRRLLSSLRSKS